jgi:hypothetical protein
MSGGFWEAGQRAIRKCTKRPSLTTKEEAAARTDPGPAKVRSRAFPAVTAGFLEEDPQGCWASDHCRGFAGEAGSHHQLKSSAVNCCAAISKDFVQRQCCRSCHGFRRRMAEARIAKRARSTCRHVTKETEIFLRSCDDKEQTLPYSICILYPYDLGASNTRLGRLR